MPDAVTHLLTARLAAPLLKRGDLRAVLYLGVLWPDVLAKICTFALHTPGGFDIPSHSLAGLAIKSACGVRRPTAWPRRTRS